MKYSNSHCQNKINFSFYQEQPVNLVSSMDQLILAWRLSCKDVQSRMASATLSFAKIDLSFYRYYCLLLFAGLISPARLLLSHKVRPAKPRACRLMRLWKLNRARRGCKAEMP